MYRDLGALGESAFRTLSLQAEFTINKSEMDKSGWDFIVEFPQKVSSKSGAMHKAALECRVQVKSTDKKQRKLQITLKNLLRLATSPNPSFFIFLEFDGLHEPQRVFVRHVDQELITQTLKRVHEINQSGEDSKLHKRKMTLKYGEEHLLESISGERLKESFKKYIGDDLADYVESKHKHLAATGFEEGYGTGSFTIVGEENVKKLIKASLGMESGNGFDVVNMQISESRFGIEGSLIVNETEGGKISIPNVKSDATGTIVFRKNKLAAGLSFDACM